MEKYSEVKKLKDKLKTLLSLFWSFFKIGAFTFGGGYAMISLIQREAVEVKKWITEDDILDIIAIAESTPGPIAINSSTFVGYKVMGFWGAFCATLGTVIPSFVVITVISFCLEQFRHLQAVNFAFNGIRVAVVALILKAFITMFKKCDKNAIAYGIMIFSFVTAAILKIKVILVLIMCALIGLIYHIYSLRGGNK